ncbi:4Fe-4S dicluster domain-containing protein [Shewanella yunxiaonensis]|uniref:4Fe-4S dicluster domain-containing protein n=1 Tax=Shewanella yunxiaonensis TaxID=2829809 RepID=A0ABX7YXQ8_9GAMM|nr:4Fe-4S dicluster domain-containing protein [Shewanella yunxiaonensis]QUN07100.1 4Fe-4S dicluster domain-containing protein [Shewanella yunxiaonensis]
MGIAAISSMLGLGWIATYLAKKWLLRPPGGQNEAEFLAKCIKCDRCRSVCPTSVIGVAHVEDGLAEARTPIMKFHDGYCTMCGKCTEVCPTGALQLFDERTVKIGLATITDTCIAWNADGCTVCFDACPYGAIYLDAHNRPVVDAQKCNGCGKCEKVCPALVLRSYVGGKTRGIEVRPRDGEV